MYVYMAFVSGRVGPLQFADIPLRHDEELAGSNVRQHACFLAECRSVDTCRTDLGHR